MSRGRYVSPFGAKMPGGGSKKRRAPGESRRHVHPKALGFARPVVGVECEAKRTLPIYTTTFHFGARLQASLIEFCI